ASEDPSDSDSEISASESKATPRQRAKDFENVLGRFHRDFEPRGPSEASPKPMPATEESSKIRFHFSTEFSASERRSSTRPGRDSGEDGEDEEEEEEEEEDNDESRWWQRSDGGHEHQVLLPLPMTARDHDHDDHICWYDLHWAGHGGSG
ncbi:unnamed protein product, partial [Symbiodinium sp. CCMP2456]